MINTERYRRFMIKLILSEENFEYDIRGLLMAFFPGEEITTKPEAEGERQLTVVYGDGIIGLSFCGGAGEETSSVEVTVNSSDRYGQMQGAGQEPADGIKDELRKETKSALKRGVYRLLSDYTKTELPWGTLTGIRPTKIAMALLEEGVSDEDIARHMKEVYLTGEEKTELSIEIAKREKDILKDIDYENGYSLYIGIPFCPTTCLYCSFTSYPMGKWAGRMDEYLDAVFKEIDYTAEAFKEKKLNTVYIGGGTPTSLSAEQMDRLLTKVEESFDFSHCQEFTVEAGRPDSITEDKLVAIRRHKVSRISINPQTMKQETLRLIGRRHTVEQIKEV
ncbi:MAG: coproporphyrinogen dehydrogenase HemZ, partial [Lachnospiraceae bacterium]|nr:coproporphyrinogen dehydrogenase HemZ [Lachnospiraceae bacterium]